MACNIATGCEVYVLATYFDAPHTENAWSKDKFGENYKNAVCKGIVKSISSCSASVQWHVDNKVSRVRLEDLRLVQPTNYAENTYTFSSQHDNSSGVPGSSLANEGKEDAVLADLQLVDKENNANIANNASVFPSRYYMFTDSEDEDTPYVIPQKKPARNHKSVSKKLLKTDQSTSSSKILKQKTQNRITTTPINKKNSDMKQRHPITKKKPANSGESNAANQYNNSIIHINNSKSSSSSSSSSDEESEGDSDEVSVENIADAGQDHDNIPGDRRVDENFVVVHETTWTFSATCNINYFKDAAYKPRLHVPDVSKMTALDIWFLFFPSDQIRFILECTNAHLRERRRSVTKQEFFKVIGLLYAMSLNTLPERRDYWSQVDGIFPAPAFGTRFSMGLHRFEEILMAMAFSMPNAREAGDLWYQVRPFIDMVNTRWQDILSPGYKMTADESMFAWYGRGSRFETGMPAVMKIKRKPKGVGCEVKTIADSASNIMVRLELNEGKEEMKNKPWQREFGAGTATTLRLTEPWHGTGRIIIGDSWFGSVKTAVELKKRGLFFLGNVKTAHKNFPLKEAKRRCPLDKGSSISATATYQDIPLICVAWKDFKIHTFVGTCSTTNEGRPAKKRRFNPDGTSYTREVPRPKLVEEYFEGSPSIDVHNHIRQSGLALEQVWLTKKWHHRIFASIFGIIETNAYLAFNYFRTNITDRPITHNEFTATLTELLIKNKFDDDIGNVQPQERPPQTVLRGSHTLNALSKCDAQNRQRVQRKCIVCSRVRQIQQKASYFCVNCGPRAVLCSPQTGRDCFSYHIQNGIPA